MILLWVFAVSCAGCWLALTIFTFTGRAMYDWLKYLRREHRRNKRLRQELR